MRTVKMQISVGLAEQLISTIPRDAVLDVFEGSLTDSYVVDFGASKKYKIGRMLCRRYLVAREIYLNAWSSGIELILTDSEKIYNRHIKELKEAI